MPATPSPPRPRRTFQDGLRAALETLRHAAAHCRARRRRAYLIEADLVDDLARLIEAQIAQEGDATPVDVVVVCECGRPVRLG